MTALRSAAPANGSFCPDRIGRAPSFAPSREFGQHFVHEHVISVNAIPRARRPSPQDGRRFPCSDLDAIDNGDRVGWSPCRTPHTIELTVAIEVAPNGSSYLQTDSNSHRELRASAGMIRRCCHVTSLDRRWLIESKIEISRLRAPDHGATGTDAFSEWSGYKGPVARGSALRPSRPFRRTAPFLQSGRS